MHPYHRVSTAPAARVVCLFAGLALFAAGTAAAQDVSESQGKGTVNYSTRVVTCTGSAAPNLDQARNAAQARITTERAAKVDAMRNCVEVVKGVKVSSPNVTVGSMMKEDGAVAAKVEGVVKNFKVSAIRYFEDGGIEVDIEVSLDGALTRNVLGDKLGAQARADTGPSGVIIDAKGLSLVAVLAPRILDDAGAEVYGAATVSAGTASVASYHRNVDAAKGDQRVGASPLVIKAQKVHGSVDLVVSKEDAAKLRALAKDTRLLAEGRVAIVKD